jgi:phosphoglycerol transferase MdoB-like AlkP superfamily enzyme
MSNKSSNDAMTKRINVFRFGLMAIPPLAWALFFAPLYMVSAGLGMDWFSIALIPSLILLVVVSLVCVAAWYGYKQFIVKQ